jgi:predicted glycoside hydrolase/deacetylase ChbG (UPF0249 family)
MREHIGEEVSVVLIFSTKSRQALPHIIRWRSRDYRIGEIGYHHQIKQGATLHHIFELVDENRALWFRLDLNTANLHWKLDAVSDEQPA